MNTPPTVRGLSPHAEKVMAHVDAARLIRMQKTLASYGAREDGGVSREALSHTELNARAWLCGLCADPQYRWSLDDAANLVVRREGAEPDLAPVMTGSHIDTQPVGGWLDGAYGVVAGLEVMLALDDAGITTRRAIEVMIWTNEEGSRFSPGAMGSSAFSEPARLVGFLASRDAQGGRFDTARDAALQALPGLRRAPLGHAVHAYVEAHIEQGPVLERGGHTLGVVTGIQGVRWYEITVRGRSAHAGTTPLAARADALLAAARLVGQLADAAATCGDEALRLTVGRFDVVRGAVNTVAEQVSFTVDLRHPDEAVLAEAQTAMYEAVEALPGGCRAEVHLLMQRAPTPFDAGVLAVLEAAAEATSAPFVHLESGAFHDAMFLADICPTAMLFVPSKNGVSHNPAEDTAPADLVTGARALAATLVSLADA